MGFAEDLFGKSPTEVKIQDIRKLIDGRIEENHRLEYKRPDILKNPSKLSEWVSAFLNAEGGLIIIGVHEDKEKKEDRMYERVLPTRIGFVGAEYPKETVEQLIFSNIRSSSKPAINIYPVRDSVDPSKAIYLVEIPQGDNPPYQAADHKYYRRLNVTKYPMEHYEIADFFGRRRKPFLTLILELINVKIEDPVYQFTLRFFLQNVGKAIAKYTRVTASFRNLKIVEAGYLERIDYLRKAPSVQFTDNVGVIYPAKFRTQIADVTLKVDAVTEPIAIKYDVICEDMELFDDKYSFGVDLLREAKEKMEQGQEVTLTHSQSGDEEIA